MESMVRKLVETIKEFISSRQEVEKFLDAQIIRSSDNKEKSFFLPVTVISKTDQKKIHLALAAEEEQQVSSRKEIESIIQQVFETNKLKLAGTTDTERRNELAIALGEINQKSKDPRERLAASVLEACISDSRLTIYESDSRLTIYEVER